MSYSDSLQEKGAGAHRQDPLHVAGQQRAPAPHPHHASDLMRKMAGTLTVGVIVLGTSLKQLGRTSKPRHVPAKSLSSLGSPHH
ncbi:MAG: hypothetical protein E6I91_15235 [Chloroflexi bacterium]|nr:MAG: hypothetical protein E6I91_15235 [Chloroflexota bacterium]